VLDELLGVKTPVPPFPADGALHDKGAAVRAFKRVLRLYRPLRVVRDLSLRPGDIVATRPVGGGPGHALIVGHERNILWHATGSRVQRTGIRAQIRGHEIHRAYRLTREVWA
jgi:hypothetical protein